MEKQTEKEQENQKYRAWPVVKRLICEIRRGDERHGESDSCPGALFSGGGFAGVYDQAGGGSRIEVKNMRRRLIYLVEMGDKLMICRMYRADSGEIRINGKNIYDYEYLSYMKAIAAVFQDYRLFNFTIAENISCTEQGDERVINRLIDEVGMRDKIDELPQGIYSRFGKEYDEEGIELSGGQDQKIAIARALYKDASMVILDEPASALDPIAEAEIYEKFNGLVADFDTHEGLMRKTDSLYYKLFHSQAENYRL